MIGNAQAELYYEDEDGYGYDGYKDSKKKDVDLKKIICVEKNVNINGILDVNLGNFPTTTTAGETLATGQENGQTGSDGVTTISNSFDDRKKFENKHKDSLVECKSFNNNKVIQQISGPQEPEEPTSPDRDRDEVLNVEDNCPLVVNPDHLKPLFYNNNTEVLDVIKGKGIGMQIDVETLRRIVFW